MSGAEGFVAGHGSSAPELPPRTAPRPPSTTALGYAAEPLPFQRPESAAQAEALEAVAVAEEPVLGPTGRPRPV
ncbi:MAG: hypothetical protein ACTHJH_05700, partial [Marmoricola sp.]